MRYVDRDLDVWDEADGWLVSPLHTTWAPSLVWERYGPLVPVYSVSRPLTMAIHRLVADHPESRADTISHLALVSAGVGPEEVRAGRKIPVGQLVRRLLPSSSPSDVTLAERMQQEVRGGATWAEALARHM